MHTRIHTYVHTSRSTITKSPVVAIVQNHTQPPRANVTSSGGVQVRRQSTHKQGPRGVPRQQTFLTRARDLPAGCSNVQRVAVKG